MNLRDLEYFVAVAELKHFGRAAERCFVSQPTLSMQLKKLEEYLGVILFERTNKQVSLTRAGQDLYQQAKAITLSAKNFQEAAKLHKDPFAAKIRLGIIPTILPYFLPKLLPLVHKHFPKLHIEVSEVKTDDLLKALEAHELDLGLLALPVEAHGLRSIHLFDEPFLLAIAHAYPEKVHSLKDLKEQHLLLLEEGHCLRSQALSFCKKQGVGQAADVRATSLETLRALVANGNGYTLMPKMAALPMKGLRYQELKAAPMRSIGFVFRASSPQALLFEKLAEKLSIN